MEEAQVVQVSAVQPVIDEDISLLLHAEPISTSFANTEEIGGAQRGDPEFRDLIIFLTNNNLPADSTQVRKVEAQAPPFALIDGIFYFIDSKHNYYKRCVVPLQWRARIMENHSGPMAGHFSGAKLYKHLVRHWWWPGMYTNVVNHCASCPRCAIVNGTGRVNRPPLHPIPVQRPFQIIGVDIMDLLLTTSGNRHI